MFRVDSSLTAMQTITSAWFHTEGAASRFAATRPIAIVYAPDGRTISEKPIGPAARHWQARREAEGR